MEMISLFGIIYMSTATILKSFGRRGIKVSNVPELSNQPWIAMTGRPFAGPQTLASMMFHTQQKKNRAR